MRFLLFFLFIWMSFYGACQVTVLNGHVQDVQGESLPFCQVLSSSGEKTLSDQHGDFLLEVPANKTIIISFKAMSYETQEREIHTNADTISISIELNRDFKVLDQMVVSDKPDEKVFVKKNLAVIDYVLWPEHVLILIKKRNHYFLIILNGAFESIHESRLPNKISSLYVDCLNNVQLMGKDSVYQIFLVNGAIGMLPGVERNLFEREVKPCVASTKNTIYYTGFSQHNQRQNFLSIDTRTGSYKVLQTISDEDGIWWAQRYQRRSMTNPASHLCAELYPRTNVRHDIDSAQNKVSDGIWLERQLSKKDYNPMFRVQDSSYIFDHTHHVCSVYDQNDRLCRQFILDYSRTKAWNKDLIKDMTLNEFYAHFAGKKGTTLKKIDKVTGQIHSNYTIHKTSFPKKISVRDGFVFYLSQTDKQGYYKLYREKL